VLNADGFVLAGGASTRMGTDKALLRVGGRTLIERALALLASAGATPRIVGSREDLARFAPVIPDLRKACGPLSGIEAGLLASRSPLALFIPVDLPLLSPPLLRLLPSRARRTGSPATIPRMLGQVQPLCALYHRDLQPGISEALNAGDFKVMRAVQQSTGELAGRADIFDIETVLTAEPPDPGQPWPAARSFMNCNSREDLTFIEHPSICFP